MPYRQQLSFLTVLLLMLQKALSSYQDSTALALVVLQLCLQACKVDVFAEPADASAAAGTAEIAVDVAAAAAAILEIAAAVMIEAWVEVVVVVAVDLI